MFSLIAPWVRRTPLALPLLGLIGALASLLGGGVWGALFCLLVFVASLCLKEWRIAIAVVLVSCVGFFHLSGVLRSEQAVKDVLQHNSVVELKGIIVRESPQTRFLQLENTSACVELRGESLCGHLGDELVVRGMVKEIPQDYLEGCFDRAAWLHSQGVVAQVELLNAHVIGRPWNCSRLRAFAADCRAMVSRMLMPLGTEMDARRQVLCALVLGERQLATPETLQVFQWSGTLHAFAVSGLHVGLIAGILWFVLTRLRINPRLTQVLILLLLAAYVFLTGMAVASQRAYLMIFLFMLGGLLRRQVFVSNIICFAALVILLIDPRQLGQAGFLLSFVVYTGIFIAINKCRQDKPWFGPDEYIPTLVLTSWQQRIIRWELNLRTVFIIAMSACLVSLPLNIIFFSSFSSYSALANICITPLLPMVMALGLLMILTSGVPLLATATSYLALKAAGLLLSVCSFFASMPVSFITTVKPRAAHEYVIYVLPYGQHACVLGNPGVLIHSANAATAQWTLCPAVRGAGFQPQTIIEPARSTAPAATKWMRSFWRGLHVFKCGQDSDVQEYKLGENTLAIYPSPCLMKKPLADDRLPIILWSSPKGRLLYLGNASASTYYYWKEQGVELDAHVVVIGDNSKQPFLDEEELLESGAEEIIHLRDLHREQSYSVKKRLSCSLP